MTPEPVAAGRSASRPTLGQAAQKGRRLGLALATLALTALVPLPGLTSTAWSAEVSAQEIAPNFALISLRGAIESGDDKRFAAVAGRYRAATVRLESPGGELEPALAIGRLIAGKRFATSVAPSRLCASACALVWLAGAPRILSTTSLIVFHRSYRLQADGQVVRSERGIARTRQYLSRLGLPPDAIAFATQEDARRAPDESLAALDPRTAKTLGLAVTLQDAPMAGAPFPERPARR
ncbi:ATP-dependent protease ClpP protease subunit [Neorhizobium galegae]|uniref:hypothetical protein n=1 Tax=Neorhizobium galegae TaxID=399 RepID=UPI001AE880C3|nr:hypothetical protein [Neorhizobium galegae]MBP2547665.1 ATP-dependent protease ClpP protease subunit [Neorhizobium galegae]